jgi:hypothetical protein
MVSAFNIVKVSKGVALINQAKLRNLAQMMIATLGKKHNCLDGAVEQNVSSIQCPERG